jgi:hypothetical protein
MVGRLVMLPAFSLISRPNHLIRPTRLKQLRNPTINLCLWLPAYWCCFFFHHQRADYLCAWGFFTVLNLKKMLVWACYGGYRPHGSRVAWPSIDAGIDAGMMWFVYIWRPNASRDKVCEIIYSFDGCNTLLIGILAKRAKLSNFTTGEL